MTTPIQTGYPDWGRYAAEATKQYVHEIGQVAAVDVARGPFFVADVKYIFLAAATSQLARVQLGFFLDAAMTKTVGFRSFDLSAGGNVIRNISVIGPYMTATITSLVHPFTYNLQVYMSPTGDSSILGDTAQNILYNGRAVATAAGVTVLTANWTIPGEAWFHAIFPARASEIRLESVDFLGNVFFIADLQGNATQPSMRVILPPQGTQLTINNPGPGVASYWYTVIVLPAVPNA